MKTLNLNEETLQGILDGSYKDCSLFDFLMTLESTINAQWLNPDFVKNKITQQHLGNLIRILQKHNGDKTLCDRGHLLHEIDSLLEYSKKIKDEPMIDD
ncbi:MAG: hypothetical protein FWC00_04170 [Firmicutes bacterium]|nr:hypothetical protein [Bacillota bacterium]